MSVPHSVATILQQKVSLDIESIDRMYLNVYVPHLQTPAGVAHFFRAHRGATFASSALMEPLTTAFIAALERFARTQGVPLLTFKKGQRKDDIAAEYRAQFQSEEGVLFIGKAQEQATVCRTEKRRNPETGQPYPWLVRSTALVNQYYIYAIDREFGPFFLKFCSYFPYNAKLCLNGHEYLKRRRSTRCCASGWPGCRIPSPLRTALRATVMTSPSCKPSSPAPRCSTAPAPAASSSRKSFARTSTWAGPTTCSSSSTAG